jgi:transposase
LQRAGRKTDVKDAEWIADPVRHGLIAKSFAPPRPLRELRDLLRYRRKLVESQAAERNRLLKLLETANIKLASVMSDVFGVSGRAMLKALIEGQASAEAMADLAKGQLRRKRPDLILALEGEWRSIIGSSWPPSCVDSKRSSTTSQRSTCASSRGSNRTGCSTRS